MKFNMTSKKIQLQMNAAVSVITLRQKKEKERKVK